MDETKYHGAVELDPDDAEACGKLGAVLFDQDDLDGAEQAFRTAIELDPKDAFPWNGLGNVLRDRGDLDGAEQAYRTAIELDPKYALPWSNMAWLEQKRDGGPLVTAYLRRHVYLDGFLKYPRTRQAVFNELVDKTPHPIFVLKITEHLSHLLLSQQWSTALDQAQLAVAKPLSILNILKDDESLESLFLRGLILFRFGDIWDDTFDVINDKYEENLLGQYYLLVFLSSLVMDTGPSEEEAQEYALSAENESSDAEQLFVAGLIFRFCEKDDHAANCWLKAGKHLASQYLLMLLRHDQENVNARDGLISEILKEENQRLKNGQVGFLRGQQLIDDIDFETEQEREQIVKCLRYDEVAFAVETLHNLVEENPRNPAWSRFAEEPVSRLKYGPYQLVDILAIKPEQRESYRDFFERNDELAQKLFNDIKAVTGSNPVERFGDVADDKYEDSVAAYLRDGTDVDAVKQKMLAFLYQSRKLDAMPTMCLLLYLEQYRNRLLTPEKLSLYFMTIVSTIGGGTVSALLGSSTAVGVIGGGVGSLLGPALYIAIGNKVFTVRHEDYREFRQRMMEALTAAQSD